MRSATLPDDRFLRVWNRSQNLAEVCSVLGMAYSTVANRASKLRSQGHDVRRFKHGRAGVGLPIVLQVQIWEWVMIPNGRRQHRRRQGEAVTLCARGVGPGVTVVPMGLRPCPLCWPVERWRPSHGLLPEEDVVVLVETTRALLVRWDGSELRDVETDEVVPRDRKHRGWWRLSR